MIKTFLTLLKFKERTFSDSFVIPDSVRSYIYDRVERFFRLFNNRGPIFSFCYLFDVRLTEIYANEWICGYIFEFEIILVL